jgi:hypothetical protein
MLEETLGGVAGKTIYEALSESSRVYMAPDRLSTYLTRCPLQSHGSYLPVPGLSTIVGETRYGRDSAGMELVWKCLWVDAEAVLWDLGASTDRYRREIRNDRRRPARA